MKTALSTAAWLVLVMGWAMLQGQELGGMLNPRLGELKPGLVYSTEGFGHEGVEDQDTDLAFTRYRLTALMPLDQDEDSEFGLAAGLRVMDLSTRAVLTQAGARLPDHLYDVRFGGVGRWRLDNDRIVGLGGTIGSPSDEPFDSLDEVTLNITGGLWIPAQGRNGHLFLLNYASNREFLPHVPIPGYGYVYRPDPELTLMAGLPANFLQWRPGDKWRVEASYIIPRTIFTELQYELFEPLALYGGFAWDNDRWYRADRRDDDDRLFYYEKRVAAGARVALGDHVRLDLGGGYGYDRFFFEGEEYSDRSDNRISISDGPFLALEARVTF